MPHFHVKKQFPFFLSVAGFELVFLCKFFLPHMRCDDLFRVTQCLKNKTTYLVLDDSSLVLLLLLLFHAQRHAFVVDLLAQVSPDNMEYLHYME